jgi:phosphoribosyl 1,2-cyclic phosphodiesterase
LVRERLKGVYGLLFEANHDITLLRESSRTWALKQRILSSSGHLSNEDSARLLEEIVSTGLKELVLGHLSQDCNRPEIALNQVNQAVGDKDVCVRVSSQESITRILPEGFSA